MSADRHESRAEYWAKKIRQRLKKTIINNKKNKQNGSINNLHRFIFS